MHNAMAYFWTARFDDRNELTIGPDSRRSHWPLMVLPVAARPRQAGDVFEFTLSADDLEREDTWRWSLEP